MQSSGDPLVGTSFENRYDVLALLGTGASGTVYKANDLLLQRVVALKIIHSHLLSSPEAIEKFKKEALTGTNLTHPNIACIYSQGVASDGRMYIVMDCFEGEALDCIIARTGQLDFDLFIDLFLQIIETLNYAHGQGVVHRDIKPSNILIIDENGVKRPILLDFGLAKLIDTAAGPQQVTQTAALLGTSAYMSPEQCLGGGKIDQRSDIYSLGCVMLECLIGKTPFQGESAFEVMYKHLNESISKLGFLKELPESMSKILQKCLQKDPQKRYQNMQELKDDFNLCSDMRDTLKRRWQKQKQGASKTNRLMVVIAAALAVGLLLFATIFTIMTGKHTRQQLASISHKSNELENPDTCYVPLNERDLGPIIMKYRDKAGSEGVLRLLKNWERKHGQGSDLNHADVLMHFVEIYIQLKHLDKAEIYAKKALECKLPRESCMVAIVMAKGYYDNGEPEKGIKYIDKVWSSFPESELHPHDIISMLGHKARCYVGLKDYNQALVPLRRLRKLEIELGSMAPSDAANDEWKYLFIEVLLQTKHLEEASAISQECVKSAKLDTTSKGDSETRVYRRLADIYQTQGYVEESNKFLDLASARYTEIGRHDLAEQLYLPLALTYRDLKKFDKAMAIYQKVLKSQVLWYEKVNTLVCMSQMAAEQKDTAAAFRYAEQALECCDKQIKIETGDFCEPGDAHYSSAVQRMRDQILQKDVPVEQKLNEALRLTDSWINKIKTKAGRCFAIASIYSLKGDALAANGRYKEALECADTAIDLLSDPVVKSKCASHAVGSLQYTANAYMLKVLVAEDRSKYADAVEPARKIIDILPNGGYTKVNAYEHLGRCLNQLGKREEAIRNFQLGEMTYHQSISGWGINETGLLHQLALDEMGTQEYASAQRILKECINGLSRHYGPSFDQLPSYMSDLGLALEQQGKYAEALAVYKRVEILLREAHREKENLYANAIYRIWNNCCLTKDFGSAEKYAKQFITISDSPRLAYLNLAYTYAVLGKQDKRFAADEEGLRKIKAQASPNPMDLYLMKEELAQAYVATNQLDKAEKEAQEALALAQASTVPQPDSKDLHLANAFYFLGTLQYQLHKNKEASQNLSQSVGYFERLGKDRVESLKSALAFWLQACQADNNPTEAAAVEAKLNKLK